MEGWGNKYTEIKSLTYDSTKTLLYEELIFNNNIRKKTYANNGNIILIEHHCDRDLNKESHV